MEPVELELMRDSPAAYRILVVGCVSERWQEWFEGMRLEATSAETLLTGVLPDQAALMGVLQRLYTLGFPVVEVQWLGAAVDERK